MQLPAYMLQYDFKNYYCYVTIELDTYVSNYLKSSSFFMNLTLASSFYLFLFCVSIILKKDVHY